MTRAATVRQADIARAIKAVQAAGLPVEGVEIVGGTVRVLTSRPPAEQPEPDVYEAWAKSRGHRAN